MKVGYVVNRYPKFEETFIVDEILAHEEAGLDLVIISLQPPDDTHFHAAIAEVRAPVKYLSVTASADQFWQEVQAAGHAFPGFLAKLADVRESDSEVLVQAIELAKLVGQSGVTHLHAHFATAPTTVARLAASLANVPYSFTAHRADVGASSKDDDLESKISDAAAVITTSDFDLESLRKRFSGASDKIVRVYQGIRTEILPFVSPANREQKILAMGPLVPSSGFSDLIQAAEELRKKGSATKIRIVGRGPEEDRLRKAIESRDLSDTVELASAIPHRNLIREIKESAAVVAPFVSDETGGSVGVPLILLEGMTIGTPAISTNGQGIPELVVDGQTGILVPEHDPKALAEAIGRVVNDDVLRVRLALKARVLMESEFSIQRNAARMREVFSENNPSAPRTEPSAEEQALSALSEKTEANGLKGAVSA